MTPANSTAKLYFEPAAATLKVGEQSEVKVMMDTGSNQVDSIDAIITYTSNSLQVLDIVNGDVFKDYPPPASGDRIDTTSATVYLSANIGTGDTLDSVSGNAVEVATLVVKPLTEGSAVLSYKYEGYEAENDSNVVLYLQGKDVLGEVVSGTYTIVQDGGSTDQVVLNVELLLQGRQRPNADKSAPVRLQVKKGTELVKEINFNLNEEGKELVVRSVLTVVVGLLSICF